jgi:hypothetical protein
MVIKHRQYVLNNMKTFHRVKNMMAFRNIFIYTSNTLLLCQSFSKVRSVVTIYYFMYILLILVFTHYKLLTPCYLSYLIIVHILLTLYNLLRLPIICLLTIKPFKCLYSHEDLMFDVL